MRMKNALAGGDSSGFAIDEEGSGELHSIRRGCVCGEEDQTIQDGRR